MTLEFLNPRWLFLLLLAGPILYLMFARPPALGGPRRWIATALRLAVLLLLIASAAGATAVRKTKEVATVFLVDHSDSVRPAMREAQNEFIKRAVDEMRPGDQAAMVVFGRDALVEFLPDERPPIEEITSIPDASATDLAGAVRLASGVFPPSKHRRIVLLTDGVETLGSLEEEAAAAATAGVEIDVVQLGRTGGPEVLVERVRAPQRVREEEVFDVRVSLRARQETTGKLILLKNGKLAGSRRVTVPGGLRPHIVTFPVRARQSGFDTFEAVLTADNDTIPQNNRGIAYTRVVGEAKVLLVSEARQKGKPLQRAIEAGGIHVVRGGAGDLPGNLTGLAGYDAVILENVTATSMTRRQLAGLRAYVRDIGGGLVAVGGPDAYGPGGWWKTPLEEALPVEMTLKEKEHYPAVAVAFAIDKSGSMSGVDAGGTAKIDIAKEAIIQAMELLSDRDYVAVYGFDSASQEVVKPTKLSERDSIIDEVASLRAGGGTDLFVGLDDAIDAAASTNAAIKHVIVLSDGQTAPGDFQGILGKAREKNVTVSAVAIGGDADAFTMRRIAEAGNGRVYVTPNADAVPRIFTRETILVARNYIIEEPFVPAVRTSGGMIRGLNAMPQLKGYVGTTKKPAATEWLTTHHDDPLLATWRFGLGKSVAWTSDAEGRWAQQWMGWPGYPKMWTQLVRWTLPDVGDQGLLARAEIDTSGVLKITVEAEGEGGYQNLGNVQAEVVDPDGEQVTLQLRQTGPGRYIGVTRAPKVGAYLVGVTMRDGDTVTARTVTGAAISYSPEYRFSTTDTGLLARASQRTGGQVLTTPELAFREPEHPARVPREIWPLLLWIAAGLFLMDVAVRRVSIGRDELVRAWNATVGRLIPARVAAQPTHVSALTAKTKQRRQSEQVRPPVQAPPPDQVPSGIAGLRRNVESKRKPTPAVSPPKDGGASKKPTAPPPADSGGSLAGRLLTRVKKESPPPEGEG